MKELEQAYFDLESIVRRCEDSRRLISTYITVLFDLAVSSAAVNVPLEVTVKAMPMGTNALMSELMFVPIAASENVTLERKAEELVRVRAAIDGFGSLHRERSNLSFALQCAHADHMAKLWKVGYTIKNKSVVHL